MKKAITTLPEGYKPYLSVDLQKNKKLAFLVNGLAILIGIVMALSAHFVIPISTLFNTKNGLGNYLLHCGVLVVGMLAYMVLHEIVHGIAMKLCGTKKVKYGFSGWYAFAGSDDYYNKSAYIFIALAPTVLWGVLLLILNAAVPTAWFWEVYIIQIINISGAAGDFYVTFHFAKLPQQVLIKDYGTSMMVYIRK